MIKNTIKKLISESKILLKLSFVLSNQGTKGVDLEGLGIRNNSFHIDPNNTLLSGHDCVIKQNDIRVSGENNVVKLGDNVQLVASEHSPASVLILGNSNEIIIDDNCRLMNIQFFIRGSHNRIHLHSDCSAVYTIFHIEQDSNPAPNEIIIMNGTTMHGRSERCTEFFLDEGTKLTIGEDCMFSNNAQVRTTDSHSIVDLDGNRLNHAKDIVIGRHCWIGMDALILKGSQISDNSILAAKSVLTKGIAENNVLIGGCPGAIIKRNVSWTRSQLDRNL